MSNIHECIWIACGSILINAHIVKAENCQQNMTAETGNLPVEVTR